MLDKIIAPYPPKGLESLKALATGQTTPSMPQTDRMKLSGQDEDTKKLTNRFIRRRAEALLQRIPVLTKENGQITIALSTPAARSRPLQSKQQWQSSLDVN